MRLELIFPCCNGITDNQYTLILLHALPASYEALQSILLASGLLEHFTAEDIVAHAINEERSPRLNPASLSAHNKAPINLWQERRRITVLLPATTVKRRGTSAHCHKRSAMRRRKKKARQASSSDSTKATNSHVTYHCLHRGGCL